MAGNKYKPGDIVELDDGREGKVATVVDGMVPILYAIDVFDSEGTILVYEHMLKRPGWKPYDTGCECGAKYERGFPYAHMFFCPKWRPLGE